ncbi:MAG: Uma2 family endonuclease [Clostridium sp.]
MRNLNISNNDLIYEELCAQGKAVELIDSEIYYSSFTSKAHNKIATRIAAKLDDHFYSTPSVVYSEQIEVILDENKVKPDVFVVCPEDDSIKTKGDSILTVPTLIFEVVSKSNASLDTLTKMELYARYKVEEYCLVYQDGSVVQLILEDNLFRPVKVYNPNDTYTSLAFPNLSFPLDRIFHNI